MKQYQEVKQKHPDCVVMLRMGDFYELFYEDAVTASRVLNITLTSRGKDEKKAPLAGVPYHSVEGYLAKLVKNGYKVAIVEQLEDPKKAKGLVKRGLVKIVTPGTIIESSMLDERENNYLVSLTAYGEEFTLASCDLSTGEFYVRSIPNLSELINELTKLQPSECIIPESLQVNKELIHKIKIVGCLFNPLNDNYFKPEKGREILVDHFKIKSLDSFGIEKKEYTAVSGALLRYLVETQKNTLSHLRKISIRSSTRMLLDSSAFRNLELIKNIKDGSSRGTLLSVIDQTATPMGARLIKKWLKSPLLNKEVIERRYDALEELNRSIILREEINELLVKVYDLERLIGRINYGNATPKDLLALKNSLQVIPLIKERLERCSGTLLGKLQKIYSLKSIRQLIEKSIREDAPSIIREGGIIKKNFHKELDELNSIKSNSKKYLQELEAREKEKTGITSLRIGYTNVFGYFIEITKKNLALVPADYIRKQTTANSERYITEELKKEEEKILGAEENIKEIEYLLFQEILKKVAAKTHEIQSTARRIGILDVICSLAKIAMQNNYIRPKLADEGSIKIKNGRHPVIELTEERFIANDLILNPGEMMIITGPNMAGKSTIMRQTALIQLMAQIGSFVPAEEAVLGIADRIFTRVGAYDDLSSGQSTFMVEMQETAFILNNATENSLIILDEIGRGTSTFDGVSIAWSVAEYICNKIKAKTLFATHYHVLNKLGESLGRIKNYNVAIKEVSGEVIFLRKLLPGGTDQSHGIHVAKLAGLPKEAIERAKEIQSLLEKDDEMIKKLKAKRIEEQSSLKKFQ